MAFHKEGIPSTIGLLESVCKSVTRPKKNWHDSPLTQCNNGFYKGVCSTIGLLESVCKSVTYSFEGTFHVLLP